MKTDGTINEEQQINAEELCQPLIWQLQPESTEECEAADPTSFLSTSVA